MPRSQKSKRTRMGCTACKTRHRKCDETAPICIGCQIAGTSCSLSDLYRPSNTPSATLSHSPVVHSTLEPVSPLVQMRLLHHFLSPADIFKDALGELNARHEMMAVALNKHSESPYLLAILLTIAAQHLTITDSHSKSLETLRCASVLREHALQAFNNRDIRAEDTASADLLFSSMVGISLMAELAHTVAYRQDLISFFRQFGVYMRTHRGILIFQRGGQQQDPKVATMMQAAQRRFQDAATVSGSECAPLLNLVLGSEDQDLYMMAIQALQQCFDLQSGSHTEAPKWTDILVWPITAPPGFAEKICEQDEFALVILSYYAVLLHRFRSSWVFGDIGLFAMNAIIHHVGGRYTDYMLLPVAEASSQPLDHHAGFKSTG